MNKQLMKMDSLIAENKKLRGEIDAIKQEAKLRRYHAMMAAADIALNSCLKLPDGGSPTDLDIEICGRAYDRIESAANNVIGCDIGFFLAQVKRNAIVDAITATVGHYSGSNLDTLEMCSPEDLTNYAEQLLNRARDIK